VILQTHLNRELTVMAGDPGLSGAVVTVGHGHIRAARDFKTHRNIVEAVGLLGPLAPDRMVELVHAGPGQGVVSMFNFGAAYGVLRGACMMAYPDVPLIEVRPQVWQNAIRKEVGWKPREFDSRAIALQQFPKHASLFKRKLDHNTADAVLLGIYVLMKLEGVS